MQSNLRTGQSFRFKIVLSIRIETLPSDCVWHNLVCHSAVSREVSKATL